jgi:hypothetical protein
MSLVSKTGFEAITYDIDFNPNIIIKGKSLADSHVVRVEELRTDNTSGIVRGHVIRQTSVSLPVYKVHLRVNPLSTTGV